MDVPWLRLDGQFGPISSPIMSFTLAFIIEFNEQKENTSGNSEMSLIQDESQQHSRDLPRQENPVQIERMALKFIEFLGSKVSDMDSWIMSGVLCSYLRHKTSS